MHMCKHWLCRWFFSLWNLRSCPKCSMIDVTEHGFRVGGIRRIDRSLVLSDVSSLQITPYHSYHKMAILRGKEWGERTLTHMVNPIFRASSLTSSRSSSIEGSLVVLFSQCHKRGPELRLAGHPNSILLNKERCAPRLIQTPPGANIWCIILK